MRYRTIYILVILACITLVIIPNAIGLVEEKNLNDLVKESDNIVIGKVTNKISYWEDKVIYTDIDILIEQNIKGKHNKIKLKLPGGTVGNITLTAEDVPLFTENEEILLFLKENQIVGQYQGKYDIRNDKIRDTDESLAEFVHKIKKIMAVKPEKGRREPSIDILEEKIDIRNIKSISPMMRNDSKNITGSNTTEILSDNLIKFEGFEGAFPNNWILSGNPTWCDTSYRAYSGSWSGWPACEGSNGVPSGSYYVNNMNSIMKFGPFDLSDATDAYVTFKHWTRTETGYDNLVCMASADGNWFGGAGPMISGDWTGGPDPWKTGYCDLTNTLVGDLRGDPSVWIAFRFTSDGSITDLGSYIDDIRIMKTDTKPTITSISPKFGPVREPASSSTQVTIIGTNFGTVKGRVKFWWRGSDYYNATIESWSDTRIVARVPTSSSYNQSNGNGNVQVIRSSGESSNFGRFLVTYSYLGIKWPAKSMTFRVNPNTPDTTGELNAVRYAANTWTLAGSNFKFIYGGTTSLNRGYLGDGINSITWVTVPNFGATAKAYPLSQGGNIIECDINVNDNLDWHTDGSSTWQDVQTILTHELGHCLGLDDQYGTVDREEVMLGTGHDVAVFRKLSQHDVDGIRYIYGIRPASSGTQEIFAIGTNSIYSGGLWHRWQSSPNGGFVNGWEWLKGESIRNPAIGKNADGHLQAFVIGGIDKVYTKWQTKLGGPWSNWLKLGGSIDKIIVGSEEDGRLTLFAIGKDKSIYMKGQFGPNSYSGWSNWISIGGGNNNKNISVGRNADGRLELFAIRGDNAVYHKWELEPNGFWSNWEKMSGWTWADRLAVGTNADGRLQLFVRGGNKAVYTRWQTVPGGGWNDWIQWPSTVEDIAVGKNADGRQMIFTIGTNNVVNYKWQTAVNGGWVNGWGNMGGWADQLAIGTNADGRVEVFARGKNKVLYRKWQVAPNDGWSNWAYIDGIKNVASIAVGKN